MPLPRVLAFCVAILIGSPAFAQDKELQYEAPADIPLPDLMKVATSLASRCEAFDLKGVLGTGLITLEGRRRIKLSHLQGFPAEKRAAVDFLASFLAQKIELRVLHKLSKEDTAKYPVGVSAPEGASWLKFEEWERATSPDEIYRKSERPHYLLFKDQPPIDATGRLKILRHDGKSFHKQKLEAGTYLQFPKDLTQELHATVTKDPDKPERELFLISVLIDGVRMDTRGGAVRWYNTTRSKDGKPDLGLWSFKELTDTKVLAWLLEFPLPFALKRVD